MDKAVFESRDGSPSRISREAHDSVIVHATGGSPRRGLSESASGYCERLSQGAADRTTEDSAGAEPSRGFGECALGCPARIPREATEELVGRATANAPSQRLLESEAKEALGSCAAGRPVDDEERRYSGSSERNCILNGPRRTTSIFLRAVTLLVTQQRKMNAPTSCGGIA